MAYENIKLKYSNFTIKDGYFFTFIHTNDVLYEKNTEGDIVFTYPLDTSLGSVEVLDACCDGINFWTIQQGTSATIRIIKKWRLESYICKLVATYTFGDAANYYSSNTFSVEAFCSTLSQDALHGSTYITLDPSFNNEIPVGTVVTIGPDAAGFYEEVTVTGTLPNGSFGLDFYTSQNHVAGEKVSFVNNLWLFNNYNGIVSTSTLLRYNLINDEVDYSIADSSFGSTTCSTFYVDGSGDFYILYVYGTAVRFFDIVNHVFAKTFTIDNLRVDGTTVIPVYGLEIENDTLYRLQNYVKYFGVNYSFSTYNYQCSTLRSFVDSISMEVYPKILPSNGVSIATVTTVINDQYGNPSQYKTAHISDDDAYGYLTTTEPLTNLQGVAVSYYRAGLTARTVTITALATQYD